MSRSWLPAAIALAAGCSGKSTDHAHAASRLAAKPQVAAPLEATVNGTVVERDTGDPVQDVEVVFRGDHGDVSVKAHGDGTFSVIVPRGTYRAFVRDSRVMSTGIEGRLRVRSPARPELAGAADEQLMSIVEIDGNIKALELPVVVAGLIAGSITNESGDLVDGAVISAVPVEEPMPPPGRPGNGVVVPPKPLRPVLGTDTVISDGVGTFLLRVPPGRYKLIADQASYAGLAEGSEIEVLAGTRATAQPILFKGCVISGKVVGTGGALAHDGAMEVSIDGGRFTPTGRIHSDGTFRWSTIEEASVDLRAWPWESAPSPTRVFDCEYGKHYDNVVLRTGNEMPDLVGTIVDDDGNPVPLAYLDVTPLDRGVEGQQERADASGHFEVYELPPGRYQLTASSPARGMVSTMVVAPHVDVTLKLGGSGRIAGTTTDLVDGSFELVFRHCGGASSFVDLDEESRIVIVRGGRFTLDHVPACALTYTAQWHDVSIADRIVVEPNATAYLELAIGKARPKVVRGIVRDSEGTPAANARISALVNNEEVTSVRADADGRFEMKVQGGAELVASNGKRVGRGTVGRANVQTEQVELVLDERAGAP